MGKSHAELCQRAASWLKNTIHCRGIMVEPVAYTYWGEIPDVIGWISGNAFLVEVKTSVADFKRDLKKPFRKYTPEKALGSWRFYFAEAGVLTDQEMPDGWGLYELTGRTVRYAKGIKYRNAVTPPCISDKSSEVMLLLHEITRLTGGA